MGFEHELIIPNEGFPFKLFQFEGKDGHYVREKHWHRSIEIFAVFEGTLAFFINEEEYPLGSGEFILLNSNEIHSISSPEANRTIVLQIPMNVLRNVETGGGLILFTHSPKRQDSKIMELIGSMYQELQERGSEYEWKVQSDFFMLVYLLLTKYRKREILPEEIRHYRKLNRLSTITGRIIRRSFLWRWWQTDLATLRHISRGCSGNTHRPIIRPISRMYGSSMGFRNLPILIIRSVR